MKKCHFLFHRPTPWESEIRCSTKIYAELFQAAGHKVSYLERFLHPGHLVKSQKSRGTWRRGPHTINDVLVMCGMTPLPLSSIPVPIYDSVAKKCIDMSMPNIRRTMARFDRTTPDVIWTAIPGTAVLGKLFPNAKVVFQAVDNYSGFAHGRLRRRIEALEKHDYQQSDHVFTIGECLKRRVQGYGIPEKKITVLGQGVDMNRFEQARLQGLPPQLEGLSGPILVWVGWSKKCDDELFRAAAATINKHRGSLVFVGDRTQIIEELEQAYTFVRGVGPLEAGEVARILVHSDVGLMLYDRSRKDIYDGQNPLKLYEYLGAGLEVISTPHQEFEFLRPPVRIVESVEDCEREVKSVLVAKDRRGASTAGIRFAQSRQWSRLQSKAWEAIQEIMSEKTEI